MIGVKVWIYKGEILDGGKRAALGRTEPEPRRRDRRDRPGDERGDRGDRGRRREAPPAAAGPAALPAQSEQGPVVQAPPAELPHPARSTQPILPPLQPPTQPSWKQELKEGGENQGGGTEGSNNRVACRAGTGRVEIKLC